MMVGSRDGNGKVTMRDEAFQNETRFVIRRLKNEEGCD